MRRRLGGRHRRGNPAYIAARLGRTKKTRGKAWNEASGKDKRMKGKTDMEDKAMQVVQGVKPNVVNWIGAAIGAALAWWTGLPPLAQALLIVQGADIVTGLLCAVTGKSRKTESGKVSSGTLLMGVMKKGLEWLVVGVCVSVGNGLGMTSVCGAAMTYMIATELVSLIENLEIFGLNVPLLGKLLDVAQGEKKE